MAQNENKSGFKARYKYWFDNIMGRGASALITMLGIITLIIIVIAGAVLITTGITPEGETSISLWEGMWRSLMRTLDAGTMGGDAGWGFRWVMFVVTLGGVFIVSALIGIINNAISDKLEELRKGKSFVIEKNHTLILGWSEKIFNIISELVIANENQRRPRIVVLADRDKVEMEDEIKTKIPNTKNTKVICRSGSSIDLDDLHMVNPYNARSIVILAPDGDDPDISVIKTVLAITNSDKRREEPYHIVSEIREIKNLQVAEMVAKDEGVFILNNDIISRMIVQTCRQSGLSVVFTELLGFEGDEIYFSDEPKLIGKKFEEILYLYDTSSVIGIFDKNGNAKLNPPMDTLLQDGDKIIAISEDDDTVILSGKTTVETDEKLIKTGHRSTAMPERTLILGWNEGGLTIVRELDNYVASGSMIKVVTNVQGSYTIPEQKLRDLKNQKIEFVSGNTKDREVLESLDIPSFDHIIVLCNSQLDIQQADAATLVTLLHLRDIEEKSGKDLSIVSEMLDIKNRELASATSADDFIVSNKIISLLLAQLSENKHLKAIYDDLFDADGSEIYLKPAIDYVEAGKEVNFYTIVKAAAMRNEVAIGYRITKHHHNSAKTYGVVMNPDKPDMIVFDPADKIIVLAED
jgi:K+/H+ antiporter YhaU regulatory subunit KhtT